MANTISGKVLLIENAVEIPTKSGNVFTKRQIVLDSSRYDQMTGEKYENYPAVNFVGKRVSELDAFKVGDLVTISFALSGRSYEKDGKVNYITDIIGFKIEPFQRQNNGYNQLNRAQPNNPTPTAAQITQTVQNAQQESNQPFPPQVDENSNANDLPF